MNIFILDSNITRCAQYHANQHVGKMILESAQMLCAVCHKHGIEVPYKTTHSKHPCTLWAGKSLANWRWLRDLALALNEEFKYRYERVTDHKSADVVRQLVESKNIANGLKSRLNKLDKDKFKGEIKLSSEMVKQTDSLVALFLGKILMESIFLFRVLRLIPKTLAVASCLPEYLLNRI